MAPVLRCAIYTRKSSEEGLEQGFNSLHAQREACEAYVLSQIGEGWAALKTDYDDGGFSGGSMDRPGLKALLADIARGLIDIVVVYKVDRLTRSLADFAKIVEAFDRQGVSFVSVTQAFNTTTSMGRLTLNVLLSFAQFEREVTGERIRDKIAASKKKGMWMGGTLPLGYDAPADQTHRALVVNFAEARTVRLIFQRYLDLRSVHALVGWLAEQNIRSKTWTSSKGRQMGGYPLNRGALFHLLKNRTYIGQIPHKALSYPGLHPAIVDIPTFEAVRSLLAKQAARHRTRATKVGAMMLKGLIFDADGETMTPSFTHGAEGRVHRYYVSKSLLQGKARPPSDNDAIRRVPAILIEKAVSATLSALMRGQEVDVPSALARVEIHAQTVQLLVRRSAFFKQASEAEAQLRILSSRLQLERIEPELSDLSLARVTLPVCLKLRGGRVWMTGQNGRLIACRGDPDRVLIRGLRAAHKHLADGNEMSFGRPETLNINQAPAAPYDRNLVRLAFLAPDIQAMILQGRHPESLNLATLLVTPIPAAWEDQRRVFGITG